MATNERVVDLVIKARDETNRALKSAEKQLNDFVQNASKKDILTARIGTKQNIAETESALRGLTEQYRALKQEADALDTSDAQQLSRYRDLVFQMTEVRKQVYQAKDALTQQRTALTALSQGAVEAAGSFKEFSQSLRANVVEPAAQASEAAQSSATKITAAFGRVATKQAEVSRQSAEQTRLMVVAEREQVAAQTAQFEASQRAQKAQLENAFAAAMVKKNTDAATASIDAEAAALRRRADVPMPKGGGGGILPAGQMEAWATRHGRGQIGLRPYEIQNLAYQANDIISGFAMGQRPFQILAQQGGQVFQVFQSAGLGLKESAAAVGQLALRALSAARAFGLWAAAAAPFIAAFFRRASLAASVQEFNVALAANADAANYDSKALANLARSMSQYGVSVADARSAIKEFIAAGIKSSEMDRLGRSAAELARITGQKIPQAAQQLAKAFTGPISGVRKLDEGLNFLSAAQYHQILMLDQQGEHSKALAMAFDALNAKLDESAAKARGPWGEAFHQLGQLWRDFIGWVSNSLPITLAAAAIVKLGEAIGTVANAMDKIIAPNSVANLKDTETSIIAQIGRIKALREAVDKGFRPNAGQTKLLASDTQARMEARLREVQQQIADQTHKAYKGMEPSGAPLTNQDSEQQKKKIDDITVAILKQTDAMSMRAATMHLDGATRDKAREIHKADMEAQAAGIPILQNGLHLTKEQVKIITDLIDASYKAKEAQDALNKATQEATSWSKQYATAEEKHKAILDEMQRVIALLTEKYGENAPIVTKAKEAMHNFNVQMDMAKVKADALASSANELNKALAHLGKFSGSVDQQIALARQKIDMIRAGKSKNEILATQDVIKNNGADYAAMLKNGYTPDMVAAQQEADIKKQMEALSLTDQANQMFQDKFGKKKTGGISPQQRDLSFLLAQRSSMLKSMSSLTKQGKFEAAAQVQASLKALEPTILEAIDNMIKYLETVGGPKADAAIAKFKALKMQIEGQVDAAKTAGLTAQQLDKDFAKIGSNSLGAFAKALADGKNVAGSFFDALRQGFANLIIKIGEAIAQQAILNALQGANGSPSGVATGIISLVSKVLHTGGVAGNASIARAVNPAVFLGAPRYHVGGVAGLNPGEVPAVLMKDEEVLTRQDPRHVLNGGKQGRGAQGVNVKNVNLFNPSDLLHQALSDEAGQEVILNFIGRNSGAVKGLLG